MELMQFSFIYYLFTGYYTISRSKNKPTTKSDEDNDNVVLNLRNVHSSVEFPDSITSLDQRGPPKKHSTTSSYLLKHASSDNESTFADSFPHISHPPQKIKRHEIPPPIPLDSVPLSKSSKSTYYKPPINLNTPPFKKRSNRHTKPPIKSRDYVATDDIDDEDDGN